MTTYGWYGQRNPLSSPTVLLIIVNVLVFIPVSLNDQVMNLLAQTGNLVFAGAYWQLFTSLFVHFGILHILFNMYGLYYFGRLNEQHFSTGQFLAIYFGSGLLGNIMSLYLIPGDVLTGGASGAIFGLVGSYVALERRMQHMGAALLYAGLIFFLSSLPGANIFAHLFGLIGGLVLGLIFSTRRGQAPSTFSYSFTT
jgi:rhomboid protease GluP